MKYLFFFSIIGLLLTIAIPYSFAQETKELPGAPETLKEAKTLGERILDGFPKALKKPWQEAVVIWKKILGWFRNFGYSIWYKINSFLGREVERRKPEIQEEFEKEKQEMKEEIPKAGKSLWERFKELIR